jgi:hypothetical protein
MPTVALRVTISKAIVFYVPKRQRCRCLDAPPHVARAAINILPIGDAGHGELKISANSQC